MTAGVDGRRFGLAIENFTPHARIPDMERILSYGRRAEALGFDSLWVWDHILLGSKFPFPFLEALSVLAGLAISTRRVQLGTGILVLPLRNPVVLAKGDLVHRPNGRSGTPRTGDGQRMVRA